jgi:hypothetical protein
MRVNIIEPRQAPIPSNIEQKPKPVVVVVWKGGEALRQKGDREEERLVELYWEEFRKMRTKKRCSRFRQGKGLAIRRVRHPERGTGDRKNRKDSQRPSHCPQKGTELDFDAISGCLRTDHAIIE